MTTVWVQKSNLDNYQIIPEPQQEEKNKFHEVLFSGNFEDLINIKFELLADGVCSYRHDNAFHQTKALKEKQSSMKLASEAIAPLQDAIDLSIATDKELMQLNAWKQYRVNLNRIDTSTAPDIDWPEKPE
ncbi:MAG: tail fiber assembly protein [Providencia sp.]|nr:tail fiber assembly protein [Providencia sp.]